MYFLFLIFPSPFLISQSYFLLNFFLTIQMVSHSFYIHISYYLFYFLTFSFNLSNFLFNFFLSIQNISYSFHIRISLFSSLSFYFSIFLFSYYSNPPYPFFNLLSQYFPFLSFFCLFNLFDVPIFQFIFPWNFPELFTTNSGD